MKMKRTAEAQRHRGIASLLFSLCLCVSVVNPSWAKPQRIVSLNLCTDQLVLLLVEPERIASVTWLAHDPAVSVLHERAGRVPANYARAEEVVRAAPDLIVAGRYTSGPTLAALRRLGVKMTLFELPSSLDDIRGQIRQMGELVEEPARAEAEIAELDRRIAQAQADAPPQRPEAALLGTGGSTAGPGSLEHEVLTAAGYANLAVRLGINGYASLKLERLVLAAPDRLVFQPSYGDLPSLASERAHHPALRHIRQRLNVPSRLWMCPGPGIAQAAERLADGRR
jgi:iron complex transport system substrate-binding protein